ncbi:MAG: substrate-binding domain-containing protein [Candidatus Borkfalkiaceae bacterium]|nr:substrate-binding domain-containing protein [Christensenellaceae bacterium]
MKKIWNKILAVALGAVTLFAFASCTDSGEKNITIVARDASSGTREAFDTVVTADGITYLQGKDADGNKYYNTSSKAVLLEKTSGVMTTVAGDKNAIGYISLGSVNETVKVASVEGVVPSKETVLSGEYKIQRPFVLMTKKNKPANALADDFMAFLKSAEAQTACDESGVIFLTDEAKRGIALGEYTKQDTLPSGDKIVIRGSTSMEAVIMAECAAYAKLYNAKAEDIFDVQLEGSSKGKSAANADENGNVIGLSSAAVNDAELDSWNICLDAVAVILNNENTIKNFTLAQLYKIYTGEITKFSEIAG